METLKEKINRITNNSAFPLKIVTKENTVYGSGLNKREYFAAMALQGLLSHRTEDYFYPSAVTELSVKIADSLIEALKK
jgi:hypothetical protein